MSQDSHHDPLQSGAAATYDAAADSYDAPALAFRDHFGHSSVTRLALRPGSRVLDVCCGTGASSLAAAEAVGPAGSVVGIDFADRPLDRARAKAAKAGLTQVEFRKGDLSTLQMPDQSFDAVLCVFGVFFVADMSAAIARLWRMVRPGGVLAITTWADGTFEPGNTHFWNALRDVRPELVRTFPWQRIGTTDRFRAVFNEVGLPNVTIEDARGSQPLTSADDWWTIVLGSGFRAVVQQLTRSEHDAVRAANLQALRGTTSIDAHVLYATVRK